MTDDKHDAQGRLGSTAVSPPAKPGYRIKKWPLIIVWPADVFVAAMPPVWARLDDGRVIAVFNTRDELFRSVQLLVLIKQARELGGVIVEEEEPEDAPSLLEISMDF